MTSTSDTPVPPVDEPGGPSTPGVVQTDGLGADGGNNLLAGLGVAALLGAGGAVVTVGLRNAARRH